MKTIKFLVVLTFLGFLFSCSPNTPEDVWIESDTLTSDTIIKQDTIKIDTIKNVIIPSVRK